MGGLVAMNGSCDQHPIKDLRRAGWGCAMMDTDTGLPAGLAYGCVPSSLPQTSQAGEYAAFAAICNLARKPTKILSDCANVVRD